YKLPSQLAERVFQQSRQATSKVLGPHRARVDADGVWQASPLMEVRYPWTSVIDLVETDKHLFIYMEANRALIIPMHRLASTEAADLKTQIQTYYGNRTP
ncbi:MAG: YcxB family protein, partial [Bradymonadaceae bacterium]